MTEEPDDADRPRGDVHPTGGLLYKRGGATQARPEPHAEPGMLGSGNQGMISANVNDSWLACPGCEYNLTGLLDDRCPECGRLGAVSEARRLGNPPRCTGIKRTCLALIVVAWVGGMAIDTVVGQSRLLDLAMNVVTLIASIIWCACDSKERRTHLTKLTTLAIILITPIGVALYFARERRWRSLATAIGFGVLVMALSMTTWLVVGRLVTGQWPT
jgi:hypothetical protein